MVTQVTKFTVRFELREKSVATVKLLGYRRSISIGIDLYRLQTSRLQNSRTDSLSVLDINSINSSVFLRLAGTCLRSGCKAFARYLDRDMAGVSVAACMGLPFNSPSLWSSGRHCSTF
jgi:hypothetical protein